MKIINAAKGTGKTTKLIQIAAQDFSYIVCANHARAHQIAKVARNMGLSIPFPFTFSDFIVGHFCGKGVKGFVVDDADELLRDLARGVTVKAISITCEDKALK